MYVDLEGGLDQLCFLHASPGGITYWTGPPYLDNVAEHRNNLIMLRSYI